MILLACLTAILLLPIAVFVIECFAALAAADGAPPSQDKLPRPTLAVLMPARDEEMGIADAVRCALAQLAPGDRLLVIADNCCDRTAALARVAGAQVVERCDPEHIGKGYALQCGLEQLSAEPPEVVIFLDADCSLSPACLEHLAIQARVTDRPAQAIYTLSPSPDGGCRTALSAFAFLVRNHVRPMGLRQMRLPCQLTGSGIAFPWTLLKQLRLEGGSIVEDLQLGIDCALLGRPPSLCPAAGVRSAGPRTVGQLYHQRQRWEHGHLRTLLRQLTRLLWAALRRRDPGAAGLALDLAVPPLSLLCLFWAVLTSAAGGAWALGASVVPFAALLAAGACLGIAVFVAWLRFSRQSLPLGRLLLAPGYMIWKVPLYLAFIFRPQRAWVRTGR